jgi:hypothetical protein
MNELKCKCNRYFAEDNEFLACINEDLRDDDEQIPGIRHQSIPGGRDQARNPGEEHRLLESPIRR